MRLMLNNVRLAFPHLWTAQKGDSGKPTFGALLILAPDNPAIKQLQAGFASVAREKWGAKGDAILKQLKATNKLCLHDGAEKAQYAGFEGNMYVSARSQTKPSVFDRDKSPLSEGDGKPYSGCYVNASIELWAQDSSSYGKRINAQLRGVQFFADGDAFAAGTAAGEDEFADLADQGGDGDADPTS